jgi:hypothetical protein
MGVCHSESTTENKKESSPVSSSSESSLSEIELFNIGAIKYKTVCFVNDEIRIRALYNEEISKQKIITSYMIKPRHKQAKQSHQFNDIKALSEK